MSCQTLGCKAQAVPHGDHCKPHSCKKQGCRRELVGGGSRHCELHGCQADGCPNAHVQGSSWCDGHVCRYERCLSQRVTENDEDDPVEACKGHRCEVDDCPKVRKQGSTSCRRHVCQYKSCLSRAQDNGACTNHTCNAQDCDQVQFRNRPYCTTHACHGSGCHVQSEPGHTSCPDHRCAFAGGCTGASQHDNDVCEAHECRASNCRRAVGGIGWEHCKAHVCRTEDCTGRRAPGSVFCERCKCADPDCGALKNTHSEYCSAHSCRAPRCTNPPDDDSSPFCTDHKCRFAGCARANSPGQSTFCSHHRCRFGRDDGTECPRGRWCVVQSAPEEDGGDVDVDDVDDEDGVSGSSGGGGGGSGGGRLRRRSGSNSGRTVVIRSKFCEKHSCKVLGCAEVRRKGGGYCATHACGWVARGGKVCTREAGPWGFCERHGCGVDGCDHMVCAEAYRFCDEHSCRGVVAMEAEPHPVRCLEAAPPGRDFCEDHTCAAPSCPAAIDTVGSTARFCASHLCSWDHGCERQRAVPKGEGGFFCVVHECQKNGCTAGRRPTGEAWCAFHWKEEVERIRLGKEMATGGGYGGPGYGVPAMAGYGHAAGHHALPQLQQLQHQQQHQQPQAQAQPQLQPHPHPLQYHPQLLPFGASASGWRVGGSYDEDYDAPPSPPMATEWEADEAGGAYGWGGGGGGGDGGGRMLLEYGRERMLNLGGGGARRPREHPPPHHHQPQPQPHQYHPHAPAAPHLVEVPVGGRHHQARREAYPGQGMAAAAAATSWG